MGKNNSKWNNWQGINFQNINSSGNSISKTNNTVQKKKKMAEDLNRYFFKEDIKMAKNRWKDAQHH